MATASKLKILLVDDHPIQLAMLRHLFRTAGHEVAEAKNGAEALLCLDAELPDVVVSDCRMPLVDGYQLCRLLKDDRATRNIPVILLTAFGGHLSRFWARTCGADAFLLKGSELAQLVAQAERLAARPRPPRTSGLQLAVAGERYSVESIQRHLGRALEQRLLESALRNAIGHLYAGDQDLKGLMQGFLDLIQELVLPGAALVVVDGPEGPWGLGVQGVDLPPDQAEGLAARGAAMLGYDTPCPCDWTSSASEVGLGPLPQPRLLCYPAVVRGRDPIGVLALLVDDVSLQEQERLFEIAAEELGRILCLEHAHQKLYQQAIRDPLTGVFNRRHTLELLRGEMEEARRYGQPLSLLAIDLDHFKDVNDRFGHIVGDQVLVEISRRMERELRKVDRLGRIGGEEFLVVCPRTDLDGAILLAERIRIQTGLTPMEGLPQEALSTLSLGVVTCQEGETEEALLERADQRLYEAKAGGRNRVAAGE